MRPLLLLFGLGGAFTLTLAFARPAAADPYRLRADAVGLSNAPQSPVGLLVLSGEDKVHPLVSAEALVWTGATRFPGQDQPADALVVLVKLKDPSKMGELRLGRQIIATGAIRPIHMDGADARATLPTRTSVEVFGGAPVPAGFDYKSYDWVAGGRAGQTLARDTVMGVSYLQQRQHGWLATEELGMDFASAPASWFDLASRGAYDLVNPGLTEANVSLAARSETLRPEVYATHRSPSHLIPATSLFSALGDIPSNVAGASLRWRAFPRLDFLPTFAGRWVGSDLGVDAALKTTLRLDDLGAGALMLEVRRQDVQPDQWTGIRGAARVPLSQYFATSTELELVLPDDPRGRGTAWPWGLVALKWMPMPGLEAAGAVEASSTPRATAEMNALVRLTYAMGSKP
jgi:hypothetical protein